MANALGRTASFVSAVETGKKPLPNGLAQEIARCLELSEAETKQLQRAADRTRNEVVVGDLSADDREFVAAFARSVHALPKSVRQQLKKRVFKSVERSSPFVQYKRGFLVPPASTKSIWDLADEFRSAFVTDDEVAFPIMDVLEFRMPSLCPEFVLRIGSMEEMGPEEGRVFAGSDAIELREDVAERAWNGCGRDRFPACHELGHFLMHRTAGLARAKEIPIQPIYCDSEWQADTFAGGLLMSRRHLDELAGENDAAKRCKMTYSAARVMWRKYERKGLIF